MAHPTVPQTFKTRRLSWVGMRAAKPTVPGTDHPANYQQGTGQFYRVRTSGGQIVLSRADRAVPDVLALSDVPVIVPPSGASDDFGHVSVDSQGALHVALQRTGGDAPGAYDYVSRDQGVSFASET